MDEITAYFEALAGLKSVCISNKLGVIAVLEDKSAGYAALAEFAITLRQRLFDSSDVRRYQGYLEIGYFKDKALRERLASWAVALELERELSLEYRRRSFEPYDKEQPLFKEIPGYWPLVRNNSAGNSDLLDESRLVWDETGQLAVFGPTYARLCHAVRPEIVKLIRDEFPNCQRYVRLDPYDVGRDLLPMLNEEAIRPANPKWWKRLKIWPGHRESAVYELHNCDLHADLQRHWEYNVRRLGRLEIAFRRGNSRCLSGMIEELERADDSRIIECRCIHVTSDAEVGTESDLAMATHIDGAINVYVDSRIDTRLKETLENGKVCDASFRTHVFRFDNLPLRALQPIADLFLRSRCLLGEWSADQFGE